MTAAALPTTFSVIVRSNTKPAVRVESHASVPAVSEVESADEVLFENAARGQDGALELLVKRYEQSLYGLLVRLTQGDTHRAEDLFQETFLNAIRRAETFKRTMRFKPWITAIAVNLVRDDARKRKVRGEVSLDAGAEDGERSGFDPAAKVEDPGDRAERGDEDGLIRQGLKRLTEVEREVVLLHFYNGMTLAEAAEALDIPLGTVKSRLHAALTRLSEILKRFKPE